jgi:hypothetical protein
MRWALLALMACGTPVVEVESVVPVVAAPVSQDWGRDWRRMDLDQLKASIEQVSGGVVWSSSGGRDTIDKFDELALTLGKPDYLESTHEDLDASLLFQKFLKDAASAVCADILEEEWRRTASERVFVTELSLSDIWETHEVGVRANLSKLLLRYHGRVVAVDDAELEEWVWLFRSVSHVTEDNAQTSWNAICVALITHPDFYTY